MSSSDPHTSNYLDDVGSPAPPSTSEAALIALTEFIRISGVVLTYYKTELRRLVSFLGVECHFPGLGNAETLSVGLADLEENQTGG